MTKSRKTLGDRMILFAMRGNVVGVIDGIALADVRGSGNSFQYTIERSLRLIREHDLRRYEWITRHFRWIANLMNGSGGIAEYNARILACTIEFTDIPEVDKDYVAAAYACILIHEATHGVIATRGIEYNARNRARIERLCTEEQNRFAARLAALDPVRYPILGLRMDFDETNWQSFWAAGRFKNVISFISRVVGDK